MEQLVLGLEQPKMTKHQGLFLQLWAKDFSLACWKIHFKLTFSEKPSQQITDFRKSV